MWANVERWLKTQTNITAKKSAIRVFLGGFYQIQGLPDEPKHLLLRANPFNNLLSPVEFEKRYSQSLESV